MSVVDGAVTRDQVWSGQLDFDAILAFKKILELDPENGDAQEKLQRASVRQEPAKMISRFIQFCDIPQPIKKRC